MGETLTCRLKKIALASFILYYRMKDTVYGSLIWLFVGGLYIISSFYSENNLIFMLGFIFVGISIHVLRSTEPGLSNS